jgi:DNA-binding PadR family transcriptional regulator
MVAKPRLSLQGVKVLNVMMVMCPVVCGADITRITGIKSGTLYPLLARFEKAGWLKSRLEAIDPVTAGRPQRRLYRMTSAGKRAIREIRELLF